MKSYQLIANWKMNPQTGNEALNLAQDLCALDTHLWIAPPAIFLSLVKEKIPEIIFGAQNMCAEPSGSYTGELSAHMLKDTGISFVILGHSERKQFGETDFAVQKKIKVALHCGLTPVVCVGEQEPITDTHALQFIWDKQISTIFSEIPSNAQLYVTYEPAWAISTSSQYQGVAPTEQVKRFYSWFRERFSFPLLYGGSVNSQTIQSFQSLPLDGFLIGSASLQVAEMQKIVTIIKDF